MTRSMYRPPWRVDLDVRDGVVSPVPATVLGRTVAAALDAVAAPAPASIGLILSDDGELAALNATHMGKDGPTDVLSFPLLPPETYRPGRAGERAAAIGPRPPGMRLHLGDVVVSIERAAEQAAEGRGGQTGDVRWSVAEEVRLLVTHGVLHVCGWDHAEPDEERAMRALEQQLLG